MRAAVSLLSDLLARVCSFRRTKHVQPGRHSSPIVLRSERGSSLPGPILPAAPSLSDREGPTVSLRLISTAAQLSCLTVRPRVCGNSLPGAQLAHSRRRERLQDFLIFVGPMSSTARQSAPQTGASISVAAVGATTNLRTTPIVQRTRGYQMECL